MSDLLNGWYILIRDGDVERAARLKDEVDHKINRMEENQNLLLYYSLLTFRYNLMNVQAYQDVNSLLQQIDQDKGTTDDMLEYYYQFFKGIYLYKQKKYDEAITHYHLAEKKLSSIPDPIESAEFHYKLASVYSQHMNILNSIQHAFKAIEIFMKDHHYLLRTADCNNLLGANHILLGNFKRAEDYLRTAIQYAQQGECRETEAISLHNLGWMYSKMGDSRQAITHLEESLSWMVEQEQYTNQVKTMYIMAKEYFSMKEDLQAMYWVDRCYEMCERNQDLEYTGKLNILKAKHTLNLASYMTVLKNEISLFYDRKYWSNVEDYCHELANYYEEQKNIEEAMNYYKLVIYAKNKLI